MRIRVRQIENIKGALVDKIVTWKHTPLDGEPRDFVITKEGLDVPEEIGRAIVNMRSAEVEEVDVDNPQEEGESTGLVKCKKCGKSFTPLGLPGHMRSHRKN